MSTNTNRMRIMKAVGSPSVEGAIGMETLAGHSSNPEAHPDYMKKDAYPAVFSGTEHLKDKYSHAPNFIRRAEVTLNKMDYERTKTTNFVNNSTNYMANSGLNRYVITSYVLYQILSDLGLAAGNVYIRNNQVVGTSTRPPSSDLDSYITSYGLFLTVKNRVDYWDGPEGIEATYLKKSEAPNLFVTKEVFNAHTHDVMSLEGMPEVMNFGVSYDTLFSDSKTYYRYDEEQHKMVPMVESVDYYNGATLDSVDYFVYEEIGRYVNALVAEVAQMQVEIDQLKVAKVLSGYVLTVDTEFIDGIDYYKLNSDETAMVPITNRTGSPMAQHAYCKLDNSATGGGGASRAEISAKLGYVLATDTAFVANQTYYEYDAVNHVMNAVSNTSTGTPVGRGLYIKGTSYDHRELEAKIGYALTADTTFNSGTTYYSYNSSTHAMQAATGTSGNPSAMGLYVKVKTPDDTGSTYDDTELKAKAGYVLTADTTPCLGTVYYQYNTSSKTMVAYNTASSTSGAPANPATANAWVKGKTFIPTDTTYDDTELQVKSQYVFCYDTTAIAGQTYYKWNPSTRTMQVTTTKPAEGWWVKYNSNLLKRVSDLENGLENYAAGIYPDGAETIELSVTRGSSSNIWNITTIPNVNDHEASGQFQVCVAINCDSTVYGAVELQDKCSVGWRRVANIISFHTYSTSSTNHVVMFNFGAVTQSGQKYRLVLYKNGSNAQSAYNANFKVRTDTPAMAYFMPFLASE